MAPIYLTREDEGGYLARYPLLLGAVAYEPTQEEAVRAVIRRAEEQAAIYRELGVPLPEEYPPSEWSTAQASDMTVPEDYAPLDEQTLEGAVALLEHSRRRFLGVAARFPPEAIEWSIPGVEGRPRHAGDVIEHVAEAEWWYVTRLADWPRHPADRLRAVRAAALDHARSLSGAKLDRRSYNYGTEWTVRKLLRCLLESTLPSRLAARLEAFAEARKVELPWAPRTRPCISMGDGEASSLRVYLVRTRDKGRIFAFVDALPGLRLEGDDRQAVLDQLPQAVRQARELLHASGQSVPALDTAVLEVQELPEAGWAYEVLLPGDERPLSQGETEVYVRAVEAATEEQASFLARLPDEVWGWKGEDGRTLEALGQEWANLDWWCQRCLHLWPGDRLERLAAIRSWAIERYRGLPAVQRERVTLHVGEEWTARKAVRRTVEHEREHTWHLEEILEQYAQRQGAQALSP